MDEATEIKARLPIEQLVANYCELKKKGRSFVALCPFHHDTHPSLLVSPDKGIAYCFACQTGGDVFSFYQAIEGVDFRQALRDLAERTGVKLTAQTSPVQKEEKDRLRECLEEAQAFFQSHLRSSEEALGYLTERQIPADLIEKFGIGFAPTEPDTLYTHLLKRGFARSEILSAGLGIARELQEERIFDRFRHRVTFPIRDARGSLIGFGGRTIRGDDAKYINSPDGPLYRKSSVLFGIPEAREAMRRERSAILVEGYFDCLAWHRVGICNVVATCGTAFTPEHVSLLKHTVDTIVLCLDTDRAGREAEDRAFTIAQEHGLQVEGLLLPPGKDPDECVRTSPDLLAQSWSDGRTPYLDLSVQRTLPPDLPTRDRQRALERLFPLLEALRSHVAKERGIQLIATLLSQTGSSLLQTTIPSLQADFDAWRKHKVATRAPAKTPTVAPPPFSSLEILLGILLTYPELAPLLPSLLPPVEADQSPLYLWVRQASPPWHVTDLLRSLSDSGRERASILLLYCEEHFGSWSRSHAEREAKRLLHQVNHGILLSRKRELLTQIREAHRSGQRGEEDQLLTTYQQVLRLGKLSAATTPREPAE